MQKLCRFKQPQAIFAKHHCKGAELLTKGHRNRILKLCTPHLQHLVEFARFTLKRCLKNFHAIGQFINGFNQTDINCGRIGIIGRLAEIDMIVGMQMRVIALFMPKQFQRTIGDNLVCIHVGGCARTALNDIDHELIVQCAITDFAAGTHNRIQMLAAQQAELMIGQRCGFFDEGQAAHEVGIASDADACNLKIIHCSRRMDAPVSICGYLLCTKQIMFNARPDHFVLLNSKR